MPTRPHASAASTGALVRPGERRRVALVDVSARGGPLVPCPPAPGQPGSEWRSWDADLPAVTAAIEALAGKLELERWSTAAPLHWHHHERDLELWIDITASARGDATEVGLQIRPAGAELARAGAGLGHSLLTGAVALTAAGFVVALFLVGSGDVWVLMLIGLIDLAFTLSLVLGLVVIPARRQAQAQAAWSRTWRRDFWAALEARIDQRPLYR